ISAAAIAASMNGGVRRSRQSTASPSASVIVAATPAGCPLRRDLPRGGRRRGRERPSGTRGECHLADGASARLGSPTRQIHRSKDLNESATRVPPNGTRSECHLVVRISRPPPPTCTGRPTAWARCGSQASRRVRPSGTRRECHLAGGGSCSWGAEPLEAHFPGGLPAYSDVSRACWIAVRSPADGGSSAAAIIPAVGNGNACYAYIEIPRRGGAVRPVDGGCPAGVAFVHGEAAIPPVGWRPAHLAHPLSSLRRRSGRTSRARSPAASRAAGTAGATRPRHRRDRPCA
ncbi:MAG: hypothetical protein QOE87_466, partial [Gaiellales bacterium]|nr:hypothetical protein [Gaiellales bacterium]